MSTDLPKEEILEGRHLLKATCMKLHDLALELGSDAKLPTAAELRDKLGVSTDTLNDAIHELELQQVLRSVDGVGIYVSSGKRVLTGNIGLIGGEAFHRPQLAFHLQFIHGLEEVVMQNKQHLMFLGNELTWDLTSCEKVDGILAVGINQTKLLPQQISTGVPVVTVFTSGDNTPSVIVDDYQGAKLAIKYLRQHKHQRIACLMEELPVLSQRRFEGYKDAIEGEEIVLDPDWIRRTTTVDVTRNGRPYLDWGRQQMKIWLRERWHKTGCTAIFVQNEIAAIGVMQALQEEGIRVPEEVSVIGFDGTELCDYVSPRLCAVSIPLVDIAVEAMELLNRQIANGTATAETTVFPLCIREGESVAVAP